MQDNWLDFLAGEGADVQGNTLHHFNTSITEEAAVSDWLTALPDYAVIEAGSADAAEFLQAQFCNDLAALNEPLEVSRAQVNGYCNPKGRLLALFHLIRYFPQGNAGSAAAYRLVLPVSVAASFVKRLSMFVLRADVKIEIQPSVRVLAAAGREAIAPLDSLLGLASSVADLEPYQAMAASGLQVLRLPAERWLLLTESTRANDDWQTLAATLEPVGSHRWVLSCIAQGEPSVHAETVEKFIPQMLNLQSIDALSFKKGCYPGQEIVARMQYLGKLKRNMRRISFDAAELPAVGSAIRSGDDADAGTLVSAAQSKAGSYEGLAVLKADTDIAALTINSGAAAQSGASSELQLPYPVELPGSDAKA